MDYQLYYEFFRQSSTAYSLHKVIYDKNGSPFDYEYIDVNASYERLMHVNASALIGKMYSQVTYNRKEDYIVLWNKAYQEAMTLHKVVDLDISYDAEWIRIKIIPIEFDYFACTYLLVTKEYMQEQEIEAFLHVNLDMLCVLDQDGNYVKVNKEFNQILGFEIKQFETKSLLSFIHEEDQAKTKELITKLENHESVMGFINRHQSKDGSYHYLEWHFQTRGQFIYASARDITERKNIEDELRKKEEKYRLMTENTSDVIWVLNTSSYQYTFISPSVMQLTGYTVEEALNLTLEDCFDSESLRMLNKIIKDRVFEFVTNLDTGKSYVTEVKRKCKNGDYVWTEDTTRYRFNDLNEVEVVGVSRNIEKRKRNEREILFLSYHDQLTGIYNRYFMEKKIKEEMKKADRYNQPLSMAILDLDHFKRVNDTWGHPVGDDVLKHISTLIGSLLRESDTFARMGGEEFAIVMLGTDVEGAYMVSEKVRKAVEEDVHSIIGKITISIGVGERLRSESYIKWYKRVDAALYHAKDSGRNMTMRAEQLEQLPIASVEVKWKQEWESGNEEIDNQHKELLHLGNNLIHMSFDEEPTDKIMEQLELLLEHIEHHFHCEESMQKEIGYPYYELHSKSHKTLIHRAHNLKQQYLKEELKATAFFTFLVDDVIMGHLLDEDVKFYPYTRNKDL